MNESFEFGKLEERFGKSYGLKRKAQKVEDFEFGKLKERISTFEAESNFVIQNFIL